MNSEKNMTNFIRLAGVLAIVIGAINFMIGGHYDMNSLTAHYTFLGINILFATLGIIMGKVYKEYTTSRTFFSLSLAMTPVHFAQLGAFIFSTFTQVENTLPELLKLSLPAGTGLTLVSLSTFIVLLPIVYLGFKILDRHSGKLHGMLFFMGSSFILIPLRQSGIGLALVTISVLANILFSLKGSKLTTFESKVSFSLLFIPSLIILGRLFYYPIDLFFLIAMTSIITIFFFYLERKFDEFNFYQRGCLILGNFSMIFMAVNFTNAIAFKGFYLFGIIYAICMQMISLITNRSGKTMRYFAGTILLIALFPAFNIIPLKVEFILLLIPFSFSLIAYQNKERVSLYIGLAGLLLSLIIFLSHIIFIPQMSMWQFLSIIGVLLILGAGFFDRKKLVIKNYISEFKNEFQ